MIVVDWRKPIASVFYNFTPGQSKQQYIIESNEKIQVDCIEKRKFTIKDAKIIKMIQEVAELDSEQNLTMTDKGKELTVTDDFLKDILENSETTGYLKEIIATIQKEQDKAIRQPIDRNVVIQGVAGSGKSSIALHRLSYLLYNNKYITPEKVLILGPSNLFISSFKGLLPELDLEGIQQSTFYDLIWTHVSPYIKEEVDSTYQHYFEDILFNPNEQEQKKIAFKGSETLVRLIDIFVEKLKENYSKRFEAITLFEERLSKRDLEEIYNGYEYLPFVKRIERFIQHVEKSF